MNNFDFDTLKFNCYDVLKISPSSDNKTIKKAYKKLAVKYHPDKKINPSQDDLDIYNQISLSYEILNSEILKKDYDNYLTSRIEKTSFIDLKKDFDKEEISSFFEDEKTSKKKFELKQIELDQKHGFSSFEIKNLELEYEKIINERNNINLNIELSTHQKDLLNQTFYRKKDDESIDPFYNMVTPQLENSQVIQHFTDNVISNYGSVNNLSQLYVEDSVNDKYYASLECAFKIQPIPNFDKKTKKMSLEEKMNHYKNFDPHKTN